jgi:two-component system cell cycle sensor histidine kinase/response regulator CckA
MGPNMILVVDDDPLFLEEVETALAGNERIFAAPDGEAALALAATVGEGLSVALVDLNLPTVDGFSLIVQMRREYPDLPIIAISGVAKGAVLESATALGANAALSKPITEEWNRAIEDLRKRPDSKPGKLSKT